MPFDSNRFVHIEPSSSNRLSWLSTRVLLGGVTPKCESPKVIKIATSHLALETDTWLQDSQSVKQIQRQIKDELL